METGSASIKERADDERRAFSWRTVFYGFALSRRHAHRRVDDDDVIFLDWHHPWLFFLSVGTMLLSCADAFLTLQLLERGMIEANPFMQAAMSRGTGFFITAKLGMTAFGIFVLVFLAKAHFLNTVRNKPVLKRFRK